MSKKFVSTVVAVILGLAATVMIFSAVSLLFEAVLSLDVVKISSVSANMQNLLSYIRNTAIGLVVFVAAAVACYCFTYFSKTRKIFGCISEVLSLAVAAFAIAFVFDLRAIVLDYASESIYTAASAYFSELITLAVAALLLCACFTVVAVKAFKEVECHEEN